MIVLREASRVNEKLETKKVAESRDQVADTPL
jgi:hypothetical protein